MCRRCHADHVETDGRGLCVACSKTDALPGLEAGPWNLTLTSPEPGPDRSKAKTEEQPTLF